MSLGVQPVTLLSKQPRLSERKSNVFLSVLAVVNQSYSSFSDHLQIFLFSLGIWSKSNFPSSSLLGEEKFCAVIFTCRKCINTQHQKIRVSNMWPSASEAVGMDIFWAAAKIENANPKGTLVHGITWHQAMTHPHWDHWDMQKVLFPTVMGTQRLQGWKALGSPWEDSVEGCLGYRNWIEKGRKALKTECCFYAFCENAGELIEGMLHRHFVRIKGYKMLGWHSSARIHRVPCWLLAAVQIPKSLCY